MEIERKFLVPCLPEGYDTHPFHQIEQAYLCTEPVVRIRQEDDSFYLTYKGKGLLSREEYNLPQMCIRDSSYIRSIITDSRIERSPLAPILRSTASCAISSRASW